MSQAKKNPKYTTPKGVLSFPYLNDPDTKYVEEGVYQADLIVDADEAQPLIEQFEAQLTTFIKELEQETGKRQNRKKFRLPYEEHEEDETKIVFKVRQNAIVKGAPVSLLFYDAKGQKVTEPPQILGGSVVKIAGTSRPYVSGANKGLTLSIVAVQMIELSDGGLSNRQGSDFGFEDEEGYSADADEPPFTGEPEGFEEEEEFDDQEGDF